MNLKEALERINPELDEAISRLSIPGVITRVETEYMNAFFKKESNPERARYVTLTLVITSEDTPEGDEYCLSLGAEIDKKSVDEGRFLRDLEEYRRLVDDAVARLSESSSVSETIAELAKEASEEYEKIVKKIQDGQKKRNLYSSLAFVLVIAGIAILFMVAMFS